MLTKKVYILDTEDRQQLSDTINKLLDCDGVLSLQSNPTDNKRYEELEIVCYPNHLAEIETILAPIV